MSRPPVQWSAHGNCASVGMRKLNWLYGTSSGIRGGSFKKRREDDIAAKRRTDSTCRCRSGVEREREK